MRSFLVYLSCHLVLIFVSASVDAQLKTPQSAKLSQEKSLQLLDKQLNQLTNDGLIVGGQVAIRRKGELVFSRSYGVVAVGSEKKVDNKTLVLIGSCSKPFTSVCLLSLVDDATVSIGLEEKFRW